MFTREQINELLKPWESSLDERPLPTKDSFAYENTDRMKAWDMAVYWRGDAFPKKDIGVCLDFICHQSDVIELLAHALSFANKRLLEKNNEV